MTGYALGQDYGYGFTEQHSVLGKQPVAGGGFAFALERYDKWRLVAVTFTIATDATAGNRYVTVEYTGSTQTNRLADAAAVTVAPSTAAQRFCGSLHRGNSEWNTGTDVLFPLSGLWLDPGSSVAIDITNVGAADQLSAIVLTFDRLASIELLPAKSDGL